MNRIEEIEQRLSQIKLDIDAEGADVMALSNETDNLLEERKALLDAVEKRTATLAKIATLPATEAEEIEMEDSKMEERNYTVESAEYRSAFLKNLQNLTLNEVENRAYAQAGVDGAIPTMTSNKFFEKMVKVAPMLSEITLLRAAGNIKFMVEGTRNTAGKHTENNSENPAADTMITVSLGAYEFMKVIAISKSAAHMSSDAFENWLVDLLAGDIARAIDNYIINDATNGLAAYTGITSTKISATAYTYGNIIDLIAGLPAAYDAEAKFLMHKQTLYGKVATIVNSAGNPIFVTDPSTGVGKIMGYPVVLDDYVTTAKAPIYFGKMSDIVGNLSQDVIVEKDASAGFTSGSIMYRGYAEFDSKVAKGDGIVKLYLT